MNDKYTIVKILTQTESLLDIAPAGAYISNESYEDTQIYGAIISISAHFQEYLDTNTNCTQDHLRVISGLKVELSKFEFDAIRLSKAIKYFIGQLDYYEKELKKFISRTPFIPIEKQQELRNLIEYNLAYLTEKHPIQKPVISSNDDFTTLIDSTFNLITGKLNVDTLKNLSAYVSPGSRNTFGDNYIFYGFYKIKECLLEGNLAEYKLYKNFSHSNFYPFIKKVFRITSTENTIRTSLAADKYSNKKSEWNPVMLADELNKEYRKRKADNSSF
jgi:hypothetical protein